MATQTQKREFVEKIRTLCATIAMAADDGCDAIEIFIDRGHQTGGSDPITDEILETTGLTVADLVLAKDFFQNMQKFLEGDNTVVLADYGATLNKLRNDY